MNICMICGEYPPMAHGGIGPVMRSIAEQLVANGHRVVVVGVYAIDVLVVEKIGGIEVHRLARSGSSLISDVIDRWRLGRYVAKLHAEIGLDVLEAPEWRGDAVFAPKSVPLVLRLHTSHTILWRSLGRRPSGYISLMEAICLRRAKYIVAVSDEVWRQTNSAFRLRPDVKHAVIYNGVDTCEYLPSLQRLPSTIVYAGSIKLVKGVDTLIKAFAILAESHDVKLDLYGADTPGDAGGSFLAECLDGLKPDIRSRVHCYGRVGRDVVKRAFETAAVVALPSRKEACPMAVLEAMATAAPVVFGACGPHSEIIEEGVDGFCIAPGDEFALAERLSWLLIDDSLRQRIGLAAREKIERSFSNDLLARQNIMAYEAAASGALK